MKAAADPEQPPKRWRDFVSLMKLRLNTMVLVATATGWHLAYGETGNRLIEFLGLLLGTLLAASGASAINMGIEADLDARMNRTRHRPVPAGRITPWQAIAFGVFLAAMGASMVFGLTFPKAAGLTAGTVLLYIFAYTPLKTRTALNTVVGAIPGAIPPVIGWVAVKNSYDLVGLSLFSILFLWQFPHFYAIAMMYREDYERAGYLMLPSVDPSGRRTNTQILLTASLFIPASLSPYVLGVTGVAYLICAICVSGFYLYASIRTVRGQGEARWRGLLRASLLVLPLLYLFMAIDRRPIP